MELDEIVNNSDVLIFDFDGTLLETEKYHMKAHEMVLSEILGYEFHFSEGEFQKNYMGKSDSEIFELYKTNFNVNFSSEEMKNKKVDYAIEFLINSDNDIFDYFYTLVKEKNDKKFYVVSSQYERILIPVLESKGIAKYFDKIYSLQKINGNKVIFYKNLENYIKCKSPVVFEDSGFVLDYIRSMGITTVGIESEMNRGMIDDKCDYIIRY